MPLRIVSEEEQAFREQMGKRLKARREALGFTQRECAKVIKSEAPSYRKVETGEVVLSSFGLKEISKKFRMSPLKLLGLKLRDED